MTYYAYRTYCAYPFIYLSDAGLHIMHILHIVHIIHFIHTFCAADCCCMPGYELSDHEAEDIEASRPQDLPDVDSDLQPVVPLQQNPMSFGSLGHPSTSMM